MCALSSNFQPQTVGTPAPHTKWTQPPNDLKLEMLRTHAASSPTELSNLNNLRSNVVHSSVFLSVRAGITCLTEISRKDSSWRRRRPNGSDLSIHSLSCCSENARPKCLCSELGLSLEWRVLNVPSDKRSRAHEAYCRAIELPPLDTHVLQFFCRTRPVPSVLAQRQHGTQ